MSFVLNLSAHRIADGELLPMGEERLLYRDPDATIEDEELLSIETADGGDARIAGAGLGQDWYKPRGVKISVRRSTPQLVQLVYEYAKRTGYQIAIWSTNVAYPWKAHEPVKVIALAQHRLDTPQRWPNPTYTLSLEAFAAVLKQHEIKRQLRSV